MAAEKQIPENEDNERWLSDGNCTYCRRKKYCKKACGAQKRRKEAILREFIRSRTGADRLRRALEAAERGEVQ